MMTNAAAVLRAWLMPWRTVRRIRQLEGHFSFLLDVILRLSGEPDYPRRRRDHLRLVK